MKQFIDRVVSFAKATWKAIGAGVGAAFVYIMAAGMFSLDQNPAEALLSFWETLTNWSVGEWIGLIIAILGAYGIVWVFPANKPQS